MNKTYSIPTPTDPVAVLRILTEARKLIANPDAWTQGVAARGARGQESPDYYDAVAWCSSGAIDHVCIEETLRNEMDAGVWLEAHLPDTIATWNDAKNRTHAEVLAAFDSVIATIQERIAAFEAMLEAAIATNRRA